MSTESRKSEPTGKAKGGIARAKTLTADQRSQIASSAGKAAWAKQKGDEPVVRRAEYGSPDKLLRIGEADVECYVLEDGTRVLSGRGMQAAIGIGGAAATHGSKLRSFLEQEVIKPYVNKELAMAFESPVRFVRPGRGGVPAIAFEATLLIDLCETILAARGEKKLKRSQWPLVLQAQMITLSFAKAGIISAIDEVTGYQEVREHDAIQRIVEKHLTDYAQRWAKKFPDEFWDKLLKAKGFASYIGLPRPSFVGHWINDIVYSRIAPGVLQRLKDLNPRPDGKKSRRFKHTQFLTENHGVPELQQHLIRLMTLMEFAIASGQNFDVILDQTMPKYGENYQLPLEG